MKINKFGQIQKIFIYISSFFAQRKKNKKMHTSGSDGDGKMSKRQKTTFVDKHSAFCKLPLCIQREVASFLTAEETITLRRVDRERGAAIPLFPDDVTTCRVCRLHCRPIRHIRLEFYVDELDGISVLSTADLDDVVSMPTKDQTPQNVLAYLEANGMCFSGPAPLNACWLQTNGDDVYTKLSPTWDRRKLLLAYHEDNDNDPSFSAPMRQEVVIIKVAGPIPDFFKASIHRREDELIACYGGGESASRNHSLIDYMVQYSNDVFFADRRL